MNDKRKRTTWGRGVMGAIIGGIAGAAVYLLGSLFALSGYRHLGSLHTPFIIAMLFTPFYTIPLGVLLAIGKIKRPRSQFLAVLIPWIPVLFIGTTLLTAIAGSASNRRPPERIPLNEAIGITLRDTLEPLPYGGQMVLSLADGRQIVTFDLPTGALTFYELWGVDPAWNPDGTQLVFRYGTESLNPMVIFDLATQTLKSLRSPSRNSVVLDDPAWSPDGRHILLINQYGGALYRYSVQTQQYESFPVSGHSLGSPHYSPDGEWIAYIEQGTVPYHNHGQIVIMPANCVEQDRCAERPLTRTNQGGIQWIDWHPDGSQLVYGGSQRNQPICVLNVAGRDLTCLAEGRSPRWSPDGAYIAFIDSDSGVFYVMRADGTDLTEIPVELEVASFDWH